MEQSFYSSSLPFISPSVLSAFYNYVVKLAKFPKGVPGSKCCLSLPHVGGFSLAPVASSFYWLMWFLLQSTQTSAMSSLRWYYWASFLFIKGVGSFHLLRTVLRGPLKMWISYPFKKCTDMYQAKWMSPKDTSHSTSCHSSNNLGDISGIAPKDFGAFSVT